MPARRARFIALALTIAAATGLTVVSPATAATTWYVSTSGSNAAACGTSGSPCNSISTVIAKAAFATGDTINVAAGTYVGLTAFTTKGANVVGTGTVILDGNAAGSTVSMAGNVPVSLTNLTLRNGLNNSTFGGGLRVQAGTVTAQDVTITANKSTAGAGVIVYAPATLNMTGGAISNNTTATIGGGGLYNLGTTKLTNVAVTGNTGALGAGLVAAGGTLTVDGGSIANNASTSTGGGVYSIAPTTLTNVNTHHNTAIYGGGVAVGNVGNVTVNGGAISNNTVTATAQLQAWGGGVYVAGKTASAATGVLKITGTTLNDNLATGSTFAAAGLGGGILTSGTTTIDGASFSGNRVTGTGSLGAYGGAIYHGGNAPALPQMTITDTEIKGGGAVSNATVGGGIAAPTSFVATGLTVSGNVAQVGGGVYTGGDTTLTNSTIKNNQATHASLGNGGGINAARPSATTFSNVILDNTDITGNTSTVYGGGMGLGFGVTTTIRNGSAVDDNTAVAGGGIFNSGALTVRDSSVSGNNGSFQGGGLYNGSTLATDTPTMTLDGASVDDNTAASGGGGVITIKGATLTATGGHFNGNSGIGGGGALIGDAAPATFDGTDFIGNTASNLGGGAILSSGTTTVSHATIRDNVAAHTTGITGLGAGIYSGSSTANAVTKLKVNTSTISGNEAYGAAAILTYSTGAGATNTASIDNSTITANTNTAAVGALELLHPATITNSTITGNTATGGASGSFFTGSATTGVAGTIISGNSGPECSAAVADGGRNLSDVGDASCGFTPAKNDVAAAPQLGLLADNGGETKTLLTGPASPALDRIPASTATGLNDAVTGTAVTLCAAGAKDQRDITRPKGAKCDIGAVEVAQVTPVISGPASADYTLDSDGAPVTFTTTGTPQAALTYTGTLPTGVTFHDNGDGTATLSGHPTSGPGGVFAITVKATNEAGTDTKSFDLKLHQAPKLSGPMASTYTVGQAGGPDLFTQSEGYPDADLTSSALPGGLDFTPQTGGKGSIAGTPNNGTGGQYDITITGDNGTPPPATWPFALTINESSSLDGPASTTFTVGTAGASDSFTTTGFPKPDLTATGLPDGLTLSGNGTAKITGTPAPGTGGEYDATVKATNGIGSPVTKDVHVTVKQAPVLVGPSDAHLSAGVYGEVIFSSDGYPVADITATGTLPAGVTFVDHHNGTATLGGTPTSASAGTYEITVRSSNGVAPDSVIELTLEVIPHLAITSTTLPDAPYKTAYSSTVNIIGGLPTYTFTLMSGSLPAGLTLNSNGTITGSATGTVGAVSTFTVKVTDGANPAASATKTLSIKTVKGATNLAVAPIYLKSSAPNTDPQASFYIGTLRATLTGGSPALPLAGQPIVFKAVGATVCTATTDAAGKVNCRMSLLAIPLVTLANGADATYAGNTTWLPSSGSGKNVAHPPGGWTD